MRSLIKNFFRTLSKPVIWLPILLTILSPAISYGQNQGRPPDCFIPFQFTAATRSIAWDNRSQACTTWNLTYYVEGFSAVSIEIDDAPSVAGAPGAWVSWAGGIASGTLPLTNTTAGQITVYKYFPWVSINLNSVTGTGTVQGTAVGYRPGGDSSATPGSSVPNPLNVVGNAANGSATSGNPVLVAGQDNSGNTRTLGCGQPSGTTCTLATGSQQANSDGVANGNGGYFVTANGLNWIPLMFPQYFNGTTWDRAIACENTSTFSVVSTTTQVIAASGSTKIRICSFDINPSTVTAGSTDIVYGTGTNCGTGTTTLTGAYTLPAAAVVDITPATLSPLSPLTTPASQAVCVRSVTSTVNGFIVWEQH